MTELAWLLLKFVGAFCFGYAVGYIERKMRERRKTEKLAEKFIAAIDRIYPPLPLPPPTETSVRIKQDYETEP
jgi:hypothetical protein